MMLTVLKLRNRDQVIKPLSVLFPPLVGEGGEPVDPVYCLYETILMSESVPVEGDEMESEFNVYILLGGFPSFSLFSPPLRTAESCFDISPLLFSAAFRASAVRNAAKSDQLQLESPQPGTLCQSVTSIGTLWKKHCALDIVL